ncbi:MAG: V-type ATPase subunit [Roseburia sp.]|nr:V-type ATPase subunit [Roseburia sp.]
MTTVVYANMLAMLESSRLDGDKLRRIAEAETVEAALKMLGDYGFSYVAGGDADAFAIAETNALIKFIRENSASAALADALIAPFAYNNAKLAYKSRFVQAPTDGYYDTDLDVEKIADGDYSEADKFMREALEALDEAKEAKPQAIDLALTRAMYKYILSCCGGVTRKFFVAQIDMKNILAAARMRRLGQDRDEFADGGKISKATLSEAVRAESFAECFENTPYAEMAEDMEARGFSELWSFERDADDFLVFATDSQCARMATAEPFLNFYIRRLVELKAIKTALVCVKTNSRDTFYARVPTAYGSL